MRHLTSLLSRTKDQQIVSWQVAWVDMEIFKIYSDETNVEKFPYVAKLHSNKSKPDSRSKSFHKQMKICFTFLVYSAMVHIRKNERLKELSPSCKWTFNGISFGKLQLLNANWLLLLPVAGFKWIFICLFAGCQALFTRVLMAQAVRQMEQAIRDSGDPLVVKWKLIWFMRTFARHQDY